MNEVNDIKVQTSALLVTLQLPADLSTYVEPSSLMIYYSSENAFIRILNLEMHGKTVAKPVGLYTSKLFYHFTKKCLLCLMRYKRHLEIAVFRVEKTSKQTSFSGIRPTRHYLFRYLFFVHMLSVLQKTRSRTAVTTTSNVSVDATYALQPSYFCTINDGWQ